MKNYKIVIWDVETSPIEGYFWTLFKPRVSHENIKEDFQILCASYKDLGSKKVHSVKIDFDSNGKMNDYNAVKQLRDYLADADILVHHNGDKFDLKKLNARLIYHRLAPLPKIVTIDTLKHVRKEAAITSNRLDYLGSYLGVGNKIKTDFQLWLDVIKGDQKALTKMIKYCEQDVLLLEKVYQILKPYMKTHPNVADVHTSNCPRCNSDKTVIHKTRLMASGIRKIQRQCNNCGSYFTPDNKALKEQPYSRA
jgi:DNA polymerase elongation subunit (family B)